MKKLKIICLLVYWAIFSNAQVASIDNSLDEILKYENSDLKLESKVNGKIDPMPNWPTTCFDDYDIWIYFDETTNEGYYTFYNPITGNANNEVFEDKEDYFLSISLGLENQENYFYFGTSNLKIGSFIDPSLDKPYLFKFTDISNNVEDGDFANIHLVGLDYVDPCEPLGLLCSSVKLPSQNNFNYFTVLPDDFIGVDFKSQPCEPIPELACEFEFNIAAEVMGDDIKLNTLNIDAQGLEALLLQIGVSKLQFVITGTKNDDSESQIVDFIDLNASLFDPINWEVELNGFASYDEFFYQVLVHDDQGNQLSCPLAEEINIVNSSLYCDIFTALIATYHDGDLVFSFDDPNNENYLTFLLDELGLTLSQIESMITNELTDADFNLSYTNDGPYFQLSENVSFYNGIDLENFEVSFNIGEINNFSGALQIEYFSSNGSKSSCLINPIVIEEENEEVLIPELDCNSIPPDVGDMSTLLMANVKVGDYITINGFPLVILSISSGNNENGIFGTGIIPLPFKKKQLLVNLSDIQVNENGQVISGQAIGKNGPGINSFPNFELPPLYIGGDICIPPPITGPLDGSGIDPVTELDGYGFDPETGIHHLTNTKYDPDGYDSEGNHIDTGELWNEDGCSREEILYAPDPNSETGEMIPTNEKCDPTGGTPPELPEFIELWKPKLDDTLRLVFENKLDQLYTDKNAKNDQCYALHQILLDENVSIGDPLPYGENNILIKKGMSAYFNHEPTTFNVNGERYEKQKNTEEKHIEYYKCDVDLLDLEEKYTIFLSYEPKLLTDIKAFIEDKISNLKNNEFDELQKPRKFREWLLIAILEYISQDVSGDVGYMDSTEIESKSPSLKQSRYYNALASTDPRTTSTTNTLEALAFEYGQGFETIIGYPRGIIAETLRKYQLSAGSENIQSLLPLNIDTSFNRFQLSILISGVIFQPTSATMDVAAVVTDTENNQKITFGGSDLNFGAGPLTEESSRLKLIDDVGVRLNNASRLLLKAGNGNTFIQWDCNGFVSVNIEGSIQFCREYVLPLDPTSLEVIGDENVMYELDFLKSFDRFFDFSFEIQAPPFELATMKGYKWKVGALGIDYTSSEIEGLNLDISSEYNSKYFDQETGVLDDLWKGFYAQDIEIIIPKKFTSDSNKEYTVVVPNLIIDDTGLTAHVEVGSDPGVLPWEEGNANGWQMSIESMNLLILQNSLAGGGIGGRIGLAVLKDPLKYNGTFYGNNLLFSVKPDSICNFSPLGVKVKIHNNSYIQAEFGDQGFFAKAHLHGELDFTGFNGGEADLILPHLQFEGLEFMNVLNEEGNKKLKFSPGRWGVVNGNSYESDPKPLISAFGLSIDRLNVYGNGTNDGLILNIKTSVSLLEESIKATGDIQLHGKLDPDESVFKMKYDGMNLTGFTIKGEIKNLVRLEGHISWFDDTKSFNEYGNGFRGAINVELIKLFPGVEVTAACQFGTVANHDYYFVDVVADLGLPLTIGPLTLNKFGGGLSKGMYPIYTNIHSHGDFLAVNDYANSPLGTTISGIKYEPNEEYGHEFKLMTGFYMKDEDIFSGMGELLIRMTESGSLDEIEVRAQCQFLKAPEHYDFRDIADLSMPDVIEDVDNLLVQSLLMPKPDNHAMLSGFASFRFNFTKVEFAGLVAAYLNVPGGVIKGSGPDGALCMVDIYIGHEGWWIWIGEPQQGRRAGLKVDLAIIEAGLQGYFDIGTKVPPFPGLPHRVAHLGKDLNITESGRTSSHGFAFGASFDFEFDASVAGTGVELGVGAGFDMMLRKYDGITCNYTLGNYNLSKELGMNGWYAMGQAWAYLDGSIKVVGINLISAGIAAVFQIQTPNPTWGLAALEIEYDAGLFGSGTWVGDIEFGSRCPFKALDPQDEFGMDLVLTIDPEKGQQDVGLDQSISINYLFPLADTISEFHFLNGDVGELTFEIDQDSFGLLDKYGEIPVDVIQDKHLNSTILKPIDFLNPDDSIWTMIKVNILKDGQVYASQSKVVPFKTSSELAVIHKSNIACEYPVDGMTNFHTEQLPSQQGYIHLYRGQAGIFYSKIYDTKGNPIPYEVRARFTSDNGYTFMEDLVYDPVINTIKFLMPSEHFLPATQYKLEIVKIIGQESSQSNSSDLGKSASKASDHNSKDIVFYTSYFRTSEYKTVSEKFNALLSNQMVKGQQTESTVRESGILSDYYLTFFTLGNGEVFDYFDFVEAGTDGPLVNFKIAPNFVHEELDLKDGYAWSYYDSKGFWPKNYKFKLVIGSDYTGIAKVFSTLDNAYKIDVNTFSSNTFASETGKLSYGTMSSYPGALSLRVEYNFPGNGKNLGPDIVKMPLLELQLEDFYNKIIPLNGSVDFVFNVNNGFDITEQIIEKITELNNE